MPSHYKNNIEFLEVFFSAFFITGLAAPISEEMFFRGILLRYFEDKYNIVIAMIVPSVLFSLVHLFNGALTGLSLFLLIIGISLAGIMYSLTAWLFKSIWASIILHMLWNLNGLFNISKINDNWGLYQYILNVDNVLVTGGEYGISASIISILGYLFIIILLLIFRKTIRQHV